MIAIICVKYEIYIWNLEHYFQLFISCLGSSWELQCPVRDMTIKSPCYKGSSMWNIRIFRDKIKNLLIQNPFYYLAQIFCIWLHKANFIMTFVLRWAMNPMNLLLRLCFNRTQCEITISCFENLITWGKNYLLIYVLYDCRNDLHLISYAAVENSFLYFLVFYHWLQS